MIMNTIAKAQELIGKQQNLTREQKEAVGLLSIGTFLEYFDLMLYVHMAVVLNGIFFSKTDGFSASMLGAFAFSATFVFRPVGALVIGWLGDNFGRKYTVILTTTMMSVACIVMANLPTYEQIGITASIIVTVCRIFQGISSMGEKTAANLYLTELIKPPKVYSAVGITSVFMTLGGSAALLVANLSLSYGFNWRIAFWIGSIVAVVGTVARTRLRETPVFADAKRELENLVKDLKIDKSKLNESLIYNEKVNKKSVISFFLIQLMCPLYLYFTYIYCSTILQNKLNYTAEAVVQHNFIVSIFDILSVILMSYLVSFIHPLKILKVKFYAIFAFFLAWPFMLNIVSSGFELMLMQIFIVFFIPSEFPGIPYFYKAFPVFKRFTSVSLIFAISRALMYVITSFGLVFLTDQFGSYGPLFLVIPVTIGYGFGLSYFEKLERKENDANKKLPDFADTCMQVA
jgi:MHS family proline/betaine transporter-like MFS transporter